MTEDQATPRKPTPVHYLTTNYYPSGHILCNSQWWSKASWIKENVTCLKCLKMMERGK